MERQQLMPFLYAMASNYAEASLQATSVGNFMRLIGLFITKSCNSGNVFIKATLWNCIVPTALDGFLC
jgi:hypothetical protein